MNSNKVVVFDLDETLGYFTELGIFIDAFENWINKSISRPLFYQICDLYAPFYLRPHIFYILRYLKEKKKAGICSKVMIYTNNNGARRWVLSIKSYLEHKLNYKLFDRIISAYKVDNQQIEKCRTSYDKSYKDLLACSRISQNTKVCFFDDTLHPRMVHNNVFYIQMKPYKHKVPFKRLVDIFLKSKLSKFIKDPNQFIQWTMRHMKNNWNRGGETYLPSTEKKKIIDKLHYFFYKF